MALEVEVIAPGEIVTDVSDRIILDGPDYEGIALSSQAEEGGVGNSDIIIDDPDGTLYLTGGHSLRARETLSESDDPYLFSGAFANRKVVRGPYRTGVSRQWRCTLVDGNSALSRMIFRPTENAKRPAETCGARGAWLLTTIPMSNLTDHRYFDTTDTTPLDAADYTRQTARQVLDDMAQQSGYDFGVIYAGDTEQYAPFYMAPDSDLLDSDLRLTNIIEEVDGDPSGDTVYIDQSAELSIDDDRLASGIFGVGDGIEVFQQRNATAVEFGRRDKVQDAPNVKTLPKLRARVNRWLSDFDSEEVTATARVLLAPEKVTKLKAQYRVQVKVSHWPGVQDWTWCRVLAATPEQVTSAGYIVLVELGMPKVSVAGESTFAILYASQGPYTGGEVWFAGTGDEPVAGAPVLPTVGLVEPWEPGSPPESGYPIKGFNILGTGTIDVAVDITAVGVSLTSHTITCAVRKNGVVVDSRAAFADGFYFWAYDYTFTVEGIEVEPDDKITLTVVALPTFGVVVPGGTGGAGETFRITGGSLA